MSLDFAGAIAVRHSIATITVARLDAVGMLQRDVTAAVAGAVIAAGEAEPN